MYEEIVQDRPNFSAGLLTFSISPSILPLEDALAYPHALSTSDAQRALDSPPLPAVRQAVSRRYSGTPVVTRTFDVTEDMLGDAASRTAAASLMGSLGGPVDPEDPLGLAHTFTLRVPVEAGTHIEALEVLNQLGAELGLVEGIEDVALVPLRYTMQHHPSDPMYGYQWHHQAIGSQYAWPITMGTPSVAIAVVDTGVALDHEDLRSNIDPDRCVNVTHTAQNVDAPIGYVLDDPFAQQDQPPQDVVGHGTHVAGLVGAVEGNGIGVVGVAPLCTLVPVKALVRYRAADNPQRKLVYAPAHAVAQGILAAAHTEGVRVINLSIGGWSPTKPEFQALLAAAAQGCVVVISAGNAGTFGLSYPAAYKMNRPNQTRHVLVVGATTRDDFIAPFSNFGDMIDIVAPGDRIYSTWPGDQYKFLSGTSMSAPIVAGVAALLFSARPTATERQVVRAILRNTTEPASRGRNLYFGHGRVDADRAVSRFCS